MFKIIMIVSFLVATAMALTFACACVVGSRYERKTDEAQSLSDTTAHPDE